ncbi:MAG: E3 ubiquitin-protein ligase hrd1 [Bathelium mastoideum]|nr:MAG: E3 ubiquitin-protein ligase hrd1 [Bathelium mastoideum]
MRLAAYAGFSTAAAAAVVLRAFHERPNFYSASVYLAQSNACLMVLTNLVLLCAFAFLFGLQRLLFGPLRPIEVEQLYEKAWFAVTETCLAMTIFREEVGGWFLVMFVSLLFGKVWGWISEGRVDFLEQQPPSDPRLFHVRLSTSLLLSMTFNILMLNYCLDTVYREARPGMMVMFAFEFAVLFISSVSTSIRYGISLVEIYIVWKQTKERLLQRRAEIVAANEASRQSSSTETGTTEQSSGTPQRPEEITEEDIEAPGWEEKGRWIFFLDLATDFFKLVVYTAFFVILMFFHGLPIHIMRDVYMTARSFTKRILDFVKYRQATKDMNERYPDATSEELGRESTCIICREDMRSWQSEANPAGPAPEQAPEAPRPPRPTDERLRPKKLPCGHILHLGCLRSWLERQQVCPTCRRSVLVAAPTPQTGAPGNAGPNQNAGQNPRQQFQNRIRRITLGPLNLQFGVFQDDQWQNMMRQLDPRQQQQQQQQQPQQQQQASASGQAGTQRNAQNLNGRSASATIQAQLRNIEQQILQDIRGLNLTQQQLSTTLALQGELTRLRIAQSRLQSGNAAPNTEQVVTYQAPPVPQVIYNPAFNQPSIWTMGQPQNQAAMGAGHPDLPAGLNLPQGWTALPLQRVGVPPAATSSNVHAAQASPAGSANVSAPRNPTGSANPAGPASFSGPAVIPGPANTPTPGVPPSRESSTNTQSTSSNHNSATSVTQPSGSSQTLQPPSSSTAAIPQVESKSSSTQAGPSSSTGSSADRNVPWQSPAANWDFGGAASNSNGPERASSGTEATTQARPATVEDAPDAEAGPSTL